MTPITLTLLIFAMMLGLMALPVLGSLAADGAVRVIAYVVSGIGFLGAGVIMKEGMNISGLTTAASLWGVCQMYLRQQPQAAAAFATVVLGTSIALLWRGEVPQEAVPGSPPPQDVARAPEVAVAPAAPTPSAATATAVGAAADAAPPPAAARAKTG